MFNFYKSESTVKPTQIDTTSSQQGVYIRICITKTEATETEPAKYSYLEAFLTKELWQQYLLVAQVRGVNIDAPTIEYLFKINIPVVYPVEKGGNGFTYKPTWARDIYRPGRADLVAHPDKLPYAIYDTTHKEERMQKMSLEQYDALTAFLDDIDQEYFKIKQAQQAALEE